MSEEEEKFPEHIKRWMAMENPTPIAPRPERDAMRLVYDSVRNEVTDSVSPDSIEKLVAHITAAKESPLFAMDGEMPKLGEQFHEHQAILINTEDLADTLFGKASQLKETLDRIGNRLEASGAFHPEFKPQEPTALDYKGRRARTAEAIARILTTPKEQQTHANSELKRVQNDIRQDIDAEGEIHDIYTLLGEMKTIAHRLVPLLEYIDTHIAAYNEASNTKKLDLILTNASAGGEKPVPESDNGMTEYTRALVPTLAAAMNNVDRIATDYQIDLTPPSRGR